MHSYRDVEDFTDEDVCQAIAKETRDIMDFWKNHSVGWAPAEASEILTRSMLDWQSSLAENLETWLQGESDAQLILAWVNLGALVEGMLKLFLCVYYQDYLKDKEAKKGRDGNLLDPDGQMLNDLRIFMVKAVWNEEEKADWNPWVLKIQNRRNTVHAYKKRELGSFDEWRSDLRLHLTFIRTLNSRIPYPDYDYDRDMIIPFARTKHRRYPFFF
jgi:hypothetical protein